MMKIGQPQTPPHSTASSTPTQSHQARGVTGSTAPPAWQDPRAAAAQSTLRMPNASSQGVRGDSQVNLELGQSEQFQVTRFNTKVNEVKFTQQPGVSQDLNITKAPLDPRAPPGAHEQAGAFLGWKSGKGELMDLSQASESTRFFATAPMNGCALIVGGSASGPTIMHANYDSDHLRSSTDHNHQVGVYTDAYARIAQQAVGGGHIPGDNLMVFDPGKYLHKDSGVSAVNVFGVKGDDGQWKLHYSAKRQTTEQLPQGFFAKLLGQKPQSRTHNEVITGELWPRPDFRPLEPR
jgi:hypothetical protein